MLKNTKNSAGFSHILILVVLIVVGVVVLSGWLVYHRSRLHTDKQSKTSTSNTQKTNKQTNEPAVTEPTASTQSSSTAGSQAETGAANHGRESEIPNYTDGNFVALTPHGGYLTNQHETTFKWTPHKQATIYEVQLRFFGQSNYPDSTPADQTMTYAATDQQPTSISLTKNLPDGDYQWRVVAKAYIKGVLTVLQSTEDRNYQIH